MTVGPPSPGPEQSAPSGSDPQYPPHWSPDGAHYWDGYRWVPRHVAQAQFGHLWPQQPGPPTQYAVPGGAPATGRGHGWLWAVGATVGGAILIGGVLAAVLAVAGGQASEGPALQQEFVGAVKDGQEAAEGNEAATHLASQTRSSELCDVLPKSLQVTDWVGVVDSVETTLGGDSGVLSVEVADGVKVSTWNNGLSDAGDGTLIDPDSALYARVAALEEGDRVTFSGEFISDKSDCLQEQSVFETSSMEHPSFTFRFSSVTQS